MRPELAEAAWTAAGPGNRRAAWLLSRSAGGWERVTADLRAAVDADPDLSGLGRAGIDNWLAVSAATTWGSPSPVQLTRIEDLLAVVDLSEGQLRMLAFCARIAPPARLDRRDPDQVPDGGIDGVAGLGRTGAGSGRLRRLLRLRGPR